MEGKARLGQWGGLKMRMTRLELEVCFFYIRFYSSTNVYLSRLQTPAPHPPPLHNIRLVDHDIPPPSITTSTTSQKAPGPHETGANGHPPFFGFFKITTGITSATPMKPATKPTGPNDGLVSVRSRFFFILFYFLFLHIFI